MSAINYAGSLVIEGDNSANAILVTQIDPTTIKVTGLGTKVNGSYSPQTIPGVVGIAIDMNGGADAVTLKSISIPAFSVDLGTGNDALVMSDVHSTDGADSCDIEGGTGNNVISMDNCSFADGLAIRCIGSSGNDAVAMSRTNITGGLLVELGDGTNALTMVNVNVLQSIAPYAVPLNDGFATPDCGAIIIGGNGTDAIAMNNVNIDCFTQIDTLGGNDLVAITNSRFGNIASTAPTIASPSVDDPTLVDPSLNDTYIGLYIETGTGSDATAIVNTTVYGHLHIDSANELSASGMFLDSSGLKDGNDSVALTKVTVLDDGATGQTLSEFDTGELWISIGNQNDAVALYAVVTDGDAFIRTTDFLSDDGADSVVIANSNFNRLDSTAIEFDPNNAPFAIVTGLLIRTGDGNDVVSIANVKVTEGTAIDTGNGTNHVAISSLVETANPTVSDVIYADLGDGNYDTLSVVNSTAEMRLFLRRRQYRRHVGTNS